MEEKKTKKQAKVSAEWRKFGRIIELNLAPFEGCETRILEIDFQGRIYFIALDDPSVIKESRGDPDPPATSAG